MREIEKRKLLVVEGKEDERFFAELLRCLQIEDIQIEPIGGKQKIHENLSALKTRRGFPQLLSLGIVRDADDNPSSAFQSVCGALEKAGLPVSEAPLITTETYDPLAEVKASAASRWVFAINQDEQYGRWDYQMVTEPIEVSKVVLESAEKMAKEVVKQFR